MSAGQVGVLLTVDVSPDRNDILVVTASRACLRYRTIAGEDRRWSIVGLYDLTAQGRIAACWLLPHRPRRVRHDLVAVSTAGRGNLETMSAPHHYRANRIDAILPLLQSVGVSP